MIKAVFCDIDGCMGDFVKPKHPLKQDLYTAKEGLSRIKRKVEEFPIPDVLFGVCTARSFYQADHIMEFSGHQGPSIFEMGNVIYEPSRGVYYLFETHEKFEGNVDLIREFIDWKNKMKNEENRLEEKFPDSGIRQIKSRNSMLTYEFESDIGAELSDSLLEEMPTEFRNAIDGGLLKVVLSRNAIDILPNLSKGEAVDYLIGLYGIKKEEVLAIGDSSHSDIDLLNSAGLMACPDNADEELKKFVLDHGGFIVPNNSNQGLLNVLDLVATYLRFDQMRNGN